MRISFKKKKNNLMKIVMKSVKSCEIIKSKELNHHQFNEFF